MTLRLDAQLVKEIEAHVAEDDDGEKDDPRECVGVVVRHMDTHACRVIRLTNSSRRPSQTFDVADKDVRRLYRELDREREYVDVVYHSHVNGSEAIPSRDDVENADLEDAHYLIVATRGRGPRRMRSWRILNGHATEERIVVVE